MLYILTKRGISNEQVCETMPHKRPSYPLLKRPAPRPLVFLFLILRER